jgi:hypothetical protein
MKSLRSLVFSSLLFSVVVAAGCSQGDPSTSQEKVGKSSQALDIACVGGGPCTLSFPVPQGLSPQDVVLSTTTSLTVGTGATVNNDLGGFGAVANLGSPITLIGNGAQVGSVVSVASVNLGTSSVVHGQVESGGVVVVGAGATVTGSTSLFQTITASTGVKTVITFASGLPVVALSGVTQTLAPGSYGDVNVWPGGKLALSAGTYQFASLTVQVGGTLALNETAGPVLSYIHNCLQFAGTETQIGGDGNALFAAFGTGAMTLATPVRATVAAPNALLTLASGSGAFAGGFFADSILVTPSTVVTGIGAVVPAAASSGLSPTLNCVTAFDSTHLGALFGYKNASTTNVELGVGPHNFIAPAPADQQQPILFLPGTHPVATFLPFPTSGHVTFTLGQQSARASASAPACPAPLAAGLQALAVPTSSSQALSQAMLALMGNPHMKQLLTDLQSNYGPQLSPFQSSILGAAILIANNLDLLTTPIASLTPAQIARVPAFANTLATNPALLAVRAAGDQTRGSATTLQCGFLGLANARPINRLGPPPTDSILGQAIAISQSAAYVSTSNAIAAVAANSQEAVAFQAMPGRTLANTLPQSVIAGLSLLGPIPTSGAFGDIIDGIGDTLIGIGTAAAGVASVIAGCVGDVVVPGLCAAGIAGGVAGIGTATNFFAAGYEEFNNSCGSGGTVVPFCGLGIGPLSCSSAATCIGGCCYNEGAACANQGQCAMGQVDQSQQQLTAGTLCLSGGPICSKDTDCGSTAFCANGCCQSYTFSKCSAAQQCSDSSTCPSGQTCQFGCCAGVCGIGGQACDNNVVPVCGTPLTCPAGATCTNGCCVSPPAPPPK